MKPPRPYKRRIGKLLGYSRCLGCNKFTLSNMIFRHDGMHLILCKGDYEDYWFNEDELLSDYKEYL